MGEKRIDQLYQEYLHRSSFPYALELENSKDVQQYLDGIYNSIIVKDIIARRRIGRCGNAEKCCAFPL